MKYSNKSFNIALREVIEKNKIKLRSLAIKTNLNYTYFSKLKNRIKQPPIGTIEVIANGLNIDPEYFLEYRIYKIEKFLVDNPEYVDLIGSYIENLQKKKKLKVAEDKTPFKNDKK